MPHWSTYSADLPLRAQGVLTTIREQLQSTISFDIGDSALDTRRQAWRDLFARMERLAALEEPWTLVIRWIRAHPFT